LALYEKALELENKDFETNFNIGILYYQRKEKNDLDKALEYLQKAHEVESTNKIVLYNIAVIHEEKEEYALAEGFYKKLLKIDNKNNRVLVNLGV
jgi:tetratricopeptide (TPR) repeat protein